MLKGDGGMQMGGAVRRMRAGGTVVREVYAKMMKQLYETVWMKRCKRQIEERGSKMRRGGEGGDEEMRREG